MNDVSPASEVSVNEIEALVTAARDAMTEGMVERLTTTAGNGLEILDRLNDEDTRAAIHSLIDGITDLHRSGALDTVVDLVRLVHCAKSAMTDNMVERLFIFMEHLANTVATEEIATLAHETKGALEDALDQSAEKGKSGGGLFSTIALMSKPETQRTLEFLLSFGGNLRERASVLSRVDVPQSQD